MKLFKIILFFSLFTNLQMLTAQCFTDGNFVALPPYSLDGTATVNFETDGTKELILSSDFVSSAGPDLHVVLANSSIISTPGGAFPSNALDLGLIKNFSGAQTYDLTEIAPDIELHTYTYVIIHCVQFSSPWGSSLLGEVQGADCSSLPVEEFETSEISISPSIVKNGEIVIELENTLNTSLQIVSITGKQIQKPFLLTEAKNTLDVSFLKNGIYLFQLNNGKKTTTKKIIIQQ